MFLCAYIPDFPAEAFIRLEPDLRHEAVVVVQGTPPLVTVVATNAVACNLGVEAGMTGMQAEEHLRFGGDPRRAHVRARSLDLESSASAALLDCTCAFSPRVEATAPDTVIADIAGLEQLFGPPAKVARDVARRCSDAGLEVHVAVAPNPDTALHIARGYTGITIVNEGEEAERLGPLPLDVLQPTQYGKPTNKQQKRAADSAAEMLDTFERWGVRNLRALSLLTEVSVVERLGQAGLQWQRFARGATARELVLTERALTFEETFELEYPVDLLEPLAFILSRMIEQICTRLQSRAMATHELQLRLQLDPDVTVDRDGIETGAKKCEPFLERTIKLPVPMLDAKTFLKLLQLDLKSNPPGAPVLKLWLRAEPVRPKYDQRGLFLPLTPEPQKLEITLARLTTVAGGAENVGSPEVLDTHRPDAFRINRFAPPAPNYEKGSVAPPASRPTSALRRFRPPQPVSVQLLNNRPATIGPPRTLTNTAEVTSTLYGEVMWCSGPWRTSGEWWNREPWEREEWEVLLGGKEKIGASTKHEENGPHLVPATSLESGSLFLLYRDLLAGTWFIEGEYD